MSLRQCAVARRFLVLVLSFSFIYNVLYVTPNLNRENKNRIFLVHSVSNLNQVVGVISSPNTGRHRMGQRGSSWDCH